MGAAGTNKDAEGRCRMQMHMQLGRWDVVRLGELETSVIESSKDKELDGSMGENILARVGVVATCKGKGRARMDASMR